MRCLLVPSDDAGIVDATLDAKADALVLDLGDPDRPGARAARRQAALAAMTRVQDPRPAMIVRIAPLSSGLVGADLDAVLPGAPEAVLLPGAVGGVDLQHLAAKLAVAEAEHGLAAGRTGIVAAPADTAAGAQALGTLSGATPRLRALLWDPEPVARALGVGTDASPVRAMRDLLVLAASACGVPAIDGSLGGGKGALRCGFASRLARRP